MFSPKLQALGIFPYKLLVDLPYIYDSLCQLYQAKRDTNNRSTNKRLSKTCSKNPSTKLEVGRTQEFYQLHPISFPFLDSKRPSQLLELHPQKCNNMNNDTLLFNFSYDPPFSTRSPPALAQYHGPGQDKRSVPEPGPVQELRPGPQSPLVVSAFLPTRQAGGLGWAGKSPLGPGKEH